MVQAENEYGNYNIFNHVCYKNYTAFVRDVLWEFLGNDVVLYTSKHWIQYWLEKSERMFSFQ